MSKAAPKRTPRAGTTPGQLLPGLADLMTQGADLDRLLRELVDRVAAAVSADRGTLYLLDAAREELVSRAAHLPELREIRLGLAQGVAGHVARTGEVVNVPLSRGDRRFFPEVDRQTGYRTESLLACPVRDRRGQVVGVLEVLNKRGGTFDAGDERALKKLAAEAAEALEATSLSGELRRFESGAESPPPVAFRFNCLVGESAPMQRVYRLTQKAAATDATVLLRGESGTGKELVARAIHVNSKRRDGPFLKVDCAALPAGLLENELFGHERGAFTGADRRAAGKFESAAGGTVFVDEIGELPLEAQGKLLGVLQDRQLQRLGGAEAVPVDARVVAATHRDLEAMVAAGTFRADLYYRIRVVEIAVPPLRERGPADLARLVRYFVDVFARRHGKEIHGISEAALARLTAHPWPGNVRELENCLEAAVALAESDRLEESALPLPGSTVAAPIAGGVRPLAEVEREAIAQALRTLQGNRTLAARALGIGRSTLQRKIREYGL
ncbi:MAG TPA: sigma 54-interacting transcriptional regulator [Myxococcales bacterium]|nr:sigma 54-interacting transcriptional regulator [Myxococcales bacterium]